MTHQHKPLIAYGWLRAILCFVFFLLIYLAVSAGVGAIMNGGAVANAAKETTTNLLLAVLIVNFSFFVSAYLFRKFIDHRSFSSLGFRWQGRYALAGLLTALAVIGTGTIILFAINDLKFAGMAFAPDALLLNIFIFAIVATGEELFFRGYVLNNLLQSLNKWLALALSALLFMFVHVQNPGATTSLLPLLMAFIGGLLFGINYIYTKNLWFGICLHFAWNFLQGPVLGYDVSGTSSRPLFAHTLTGPQILTGGVFGYEGSILCILLSIAAMGLLIFRYRRYSNIGV